MTKQQIAAEVERRMSDPELRASVAREVTRQMGTRAVRAAVAREVDIRLAAERLSVRFGELYG